MKFPGGRFVLRLPKSTLQSLGNHRTRSYPSGVERVPALYNVFQSQNYSDFYISRLMNPALRRTYAQKAVSRPKAHTGRTTTAARKAPTTSSTKAAKKPAPKKTTPKAVPKAKSQAKPRIKPKPKPAKKKKAKAKAKPKPKVKKPKKVLTEEQKIALTKKKLKETALKSPPGIPQSTWVVFVSEKLKGATGNNLGGLTKAASAEYKKLTPERLEVRLLDTKDPFSPTNTRKHYNHIANQNKAANATAYRKWIESHTPTIIHEANLARQHLKRLGVSVSQLQDHRQVKGLRNSYSFFLQQRMQSGDFRGLKTVEGAKLVGREWKGLSAGEKKVCRYRHWADSSADVL